MKLLLGDCLSLLKDIPDNSIDSIVTDPPYGISFMNKKWDYQIPSVEIWKECLRVLKPGGHLISFASTKTHHRMTVNIEDAGFDIRDTIAYVFSQGMPKSLDVSKAIDKFFNKEREIIGIDPIRAAKLVNQQGNYKTDAGWSMGNRNIHITKPATPQAEQWDGYGTNLKPAYEPITLARKPLELSVVENILKYGTGGLNIDDCRVEPTGESKERIDEPSQSKRYTKEGSTNFAKTPGIRGGDPKGRFPANFIHDGSEEIKESLPNNAARFFYCAKPSKKERGINNNHPTVKPISLMSYLCKLVTPANGTILDPFMGSGSTGIAAKEEGFHFIGIEIDPDYYQIACNRLQFNLK